jgi:hypothetical protein
MTDSVVVEPVYPNMTGSMDEALAWSIRSVW